MQNNKKALKKSATPKKPVQSLAAKKSAPKSAGKKVVKTTAMKSGGSKATAKKPVAKAAAPKKAAAPVKSTAKDAKKKSPAPATVKATVKATAKSAKPAKDPKVDKTATKAAPTKAATPLKLVKAAVPQEQEEAAPKPAKVKKGRVPEIVEEVVEEEVVLLDADGRRYCRVRECDQASAVDGYCRFHYLLFWKNIQVRKKILSEGKLERYIEELTARYPDKYLEMLKKDLRSEKEFLAAIQELEIDEASVDNDYEDEAQNYLDEVRGMSSETGSNDRDEEF